MSAIIDPKPVPAHPLSYVLSDLRQEVKAQERVIGDLRTQRGGLERRLATSVARELQLIKEVDRLKSELLTARTAFFETVTTSTCTALPKAAYDYTSAPEPYTFENGTPFKGVEHGVDQRGYDVEMRKHERRYRGYAIDFNAETDQAFPESPRSDRLKNK